MRGCFRINTVCSSSTVGVSVARRRALCPSAQLWSGDLGQPGSHQALPRVTALTDEIRPKWHSSPYIVHYFEQSLSKVMYYIGSHLGCQLLNTVQSQWSPPTPTRCGQNEQAKWAFRGGERGETWPHTALSSPLARVLGLTVGMRQQSQMRVFNCRGNGMHQFSTLNDCQPTQYETQATHSCVSVHVSNSHQFNTSRYMYMSVCFVSYWYSMLNHARLQTPQLEKTLVTFESA